MLFEILHNLYTYLFASILSVHVRNYNVSKLCVYVSNISLRYAG